MSAIQYNALVQRAHKLYAGGQFPDCRTVCHELMRVRRNDPEALKMLARLDWREARRDQAVEQMLKYVRLYPRDVNGRLMLVNMLGDRGRQREAITQCRQVLRLAPNNPDGIRGLAYALDRNGEPEKAREVLEPFIANGGATPAMALVYATIEMNAKNFDRAVEVALPHAENEHNDDSSRRGLCFVLGQSYERLGEIDKSFAAYTAANSIGAPDFDPDDYDRRVDELMQVFSKENLARLPKAKHGSELPVFISCRPRSGSTLIERILGSHPQLHAGGEHGELRTICIELGLLIGSTLSWPKAAADLDQGDVEMLSKRYLDAILAMNRAAKRHTNKHLSNWERLGLVQLLFPNARVIDLRRERVDQALACYFIDLGPQFPYSYRLDHLGRTRRSYERLMDHWHEVLSIPILQVNYEDVVADQEYWSRKMIEFVGFPWHENVLRFHEVGEKKGSDTPTLSYAQVRQPIYKSSVGRAEKFRAHIGPLLESLGEG